MSEKRSYKKRKSLSCLNCRSRKVKCDRKVPCTACKDLKKESNPCIYEDVEEVRTVSTAVKNNSKTFDLSDIVYFKEYNDIRIFFGATSWKAMLQQTTNVIPPLGTILDQTNEEMKTLPLPERSKELPNDINIESFITYEKGIDAVGTFLRQNNTLTKCFNGSTLFEYLNEVVTKQNVNKEAHNTKISIVLSLIALSNFYNDERPDYSVIVASKAYLYKKDIRPTLPTLTALVLLYECRKYDCNLDFPECIAFDQSLFSTTISIALTVGIHRNVSQLYPNDASLVVSLNNMWKFLMFEDALRSFQKGSQPLINDAYVTNETLLLERSRYTKFILMFRKLNYQINSCTMSSNVNLDGALAELEDMISELPPDMSFEDEILRMLLYSYAQSLTMMRYLKTRTENTRYPAFRYSLLLYKFSKALFLRITGQNHKSRPNKYFHEIKDSIFRSEFFLVILVFESCDRINAIGGNMSFEDVLETKLDVSTDVFWLLNLVTNEIQVGISHMSNVSLMARSMVIFINKILHFILNNLESKTTQTLDFDFSPLSLPDFDIDSLPFEEWGPFL